MGEKSTICNPTRVTLSTGCGNRSINGMTLASVTSSDVVVEYFASVIL
jgi:hypothetical protein